jgi:hypothetical protein
MRTLFLLLSLADLALTWWLLTQAGGAVYESNPLAGWCLANHGWLGLAAFKVALVVLVLGLATIICRQRPRVAGHLLRFGCAVLGVVVVYGSALAYQADARLEAANEEVAADREVLNRASAEVFRVRQAYGALRDHLADALSAGHYTLAQASERLATAERPAGASAWHALPEFAGCSLQEILARQLLASVRGSASMSGQRAAAEVVFQRLAAEYAATFGRVPPPGLLRWEGQ